MFWKLLLAIGAITFVVGGIDLAGKADQECAHVTWGHQGSARFGSFAYTCWSDRQWDNKDDYQLVGASGASAKPAATAAMTGAQAATLAFGAALVALTLVTWPLLPNLTWRRRRIIAANAQYAALLEQMEREIRNESAHAASSSPGSNAGEIDAAVDDDDGVERCPDCNAVLEEVEANEFRDDDPDNETYECPECGEEWRYDDSGNLKETYA
jgi:DNA-directed RNA polymerase subunit M/transcription elongation factor TFIIS